jgi:hypothetical protein
MKQGNDPSRYSSSIDIENSVAAVENDKIRFLIGSEH